MISSFTLGYIYEIVLEYPSILKDTTRYFSFCPVKVKSNEDEFSKWQHEHNHLRYRPTEKLLLQQTNKSMYVIEGRMLDWYLDHGMKLTCIHRKLIYQKSTWLRPYIKANQDEKVKAMAAFDGIIIMF